LNDFVALTCDTRNITTIVHDLLQLCYGFAIKQHRDNRWGAAEMVKSDKSGLTRTKEPALTAVRTRDWRKAMSDHVAYGLLVYTGLQIFVTVKALAEGSSTALPYLALIVLVAGIIPVCRWFEKRWADLSDAEAIDPAFAAAFRRDALTLWALAIGLPFALTLIFKMLLRVF
jgi:hypothetical protein